MSLSIQTQRRLPKIKAGILQGDNYETIGTACGVTEKTIDRDMKAWLQTGDFETWVKEEFLRLHAMIIKAYPETAYREIARMVGKMLTRKIEAHSIEEIKVEEKHVAIVADYTSAIEAAVNADLAALRARKQVDT